MIETVDNEFTVHGKVKMLNEKKTNDLTFRIIR